VAEEQPSIADIAVAVTIAHSDMGHRFFKTKMIAERIGLSRMGYELIVPAIERDVELVAKAVELLKELAEIEPEVRALIARRKRGSWLSLIKKAAV
jgi:hypothetical protein